MPVYNTDPAQLERAIQSVINQLYPYWELCISDDASTNPAVRPILEKFAKTDSRIKVAYRDTNGHIAVNSNEALRLATGEYIGMLDHDDELAEQALFWFVNEIQKYPDVAIIYCDEDKLDDNGTRREPAVQAGLESGVDHGSELRLPHDDVSQEPARPRWRVSRRI